MDQRGYERDLKLDLFATKRARAGQSRNLRKRAGELLCGFDQRRARQRPLSRFTPKVRGLLDQSCLCAVTRQQFRQVLSNLSELALKRFGNTGVQSASRLAQ
jgi:hypothetical protein